MYYTIYKTTNMITNQIYIGQHKTSKLNDGYIGSGIRLWFSIKKYGIENFKKEILYIFDNFKNMNDKEIELVSEDFIIREDVLNICLGGQRNISKTLVVCMQDNPEFYFRIPNKLYDKTTMQTSTSNTVAVIDKITNIKKRISVKEYKNNKQLYDTLLTNRVTILDYSDDKTKSILKSEYDDTKHKKIFGGIVSNVDGKNMYVSKKEFIEKNLKGVHSGKITVFCKTNNKRMHVRTEEYHSNRKNYESLTENHLTITLKNTNKRIYLHKNDLVNYDRDDILMSTEGFKTVFCLKDKRFKNIKCEAFDRNIHKLASDKKIEIYKNNEYLFTYWGTKKDFTKETGISLIVWDSIIKKKKFITTRSKNKKYNEYDFKLIDWRN